MQDTANHKESQVKTNLEYWTDRIAKELMAERSSGRGIIVNDSKTPSGRIHVGSLRGTVIHDAVFKSLVQGGADGVRFLYGFDDMDPLDSLPIYLDRERFEKFMGHPFCNIPSPEAGFENFAKFFASEFIEVFENLGCHPEIYWMSDVYRSGRMNDVIRMSLENAAKVREIYERISGTVKPGDWLPFQPVCENCGRIGTTRAYDFDGETVAYTCEPAMVEWAKGCGHSGRRSPFNGGGKLPWKLEWAGRWPVLGVSFECAGKDHFTKTGSRAVSEEISRSVYGYAPPEGFGYEFFLIGGKKMSSSKGRGVSAKEISGMVPPQILRFLLMKTRPTAQLDFDPGGPTLPRLFDEFDRYERMYFGLEEIPSGQAVNVSRIYELCQLGQVPKEAPKRVPFSHAAVLVQFFADDVKVLEQLEKSGHIDSASGAPETVVERIRFARSWTNTHAAPEMLTRILEALPDPSSFSDSEKKVFSSLAELFSAKTNPGEDEVMQTLRDAAGTAGLEVRDAFGAVYRLFLGKPAGPRLGVFLPALERDFTVKRLKLEK